MSFSDSNVNKRLRTFGKVFKDIHAYSKAQGKQVCGMVKSTEVMSSLKQSEALNGNKPFFTRGTSSQVKHKSLKEDDEAALWKSDFDDDRLPSMHVENNIQAIEFESNKSNNQRQGSSNRQKNYYTHDGNTGWIDSQGNFRTDKSTKNGIRGIRIPFLK